MYVFNPSLLSEPCGSEVNDAVVLNRLDALGAAGFVGCEYRPAKGTAAGLGWLDMWPQSAEAALRSTWREQL